jgi:hypothetical protein
MLWAATPAMASFWASDLIYIPAVAHNQGLNDSNWRSDLYITNVDEVAIDVMMVFLSTGLQSNSSLFNDRTFWLGGREEDGFGFVDEVLADIPPGATVVLEDVVGQYWSEQAVVGGLGAMVLFAYEADSLEDDGSRIFRNVVVMTRAYTNMTFYEPNPDAEGEFLEVEGTYGQEVPGVPWYNLADPSAVDEDSDFTFYVLVGGAENDDFRYNVGLLNASDPLTAITVSLQPTQSDGEPFLDDLGNPLGTVVTLPPLAHIQYNQLLRATFGLEDVEAVLVRVGFISWSSSSNEPTPAMTTYGSIADNNTNDPTTVLPSFATPYPVECVFPDEENPTKSSAGVRSVASRPLSPPPRVVTGD